MAKVDDRLTPGAQLLIRRAEEAREEGKFAELGLNHWLLAVLTRHSMMAESLAPGLESTPLKKQVYSHLREGDFGGGLAKDEAVEKALAWAKRLGRDQASEKDLASVVLAAVGYKITETGPSPSDNPQKEGGETPEQMDVLLTEVFGDRGLPDDKSKAPISGYRPRAKNPTPTLEKYGRDLTQEAIAGKLPPVVGRDQEIQLITEILCRKTKRNPALVGDAGVGKTAVVEGFAQRVVKGEVPALLQGVRVLAIQPSSLAAGASYSGEFEKRMKALLDETSQDGIILFIDEVHSIIGAGGSKGSSDFASLLKPALARGEMACIAATTGEEYRAYIEPDAALERRFQPVYVSELTPQQTLLVLADLGKELERLRGVRVSGEVREWLVRFADQFLRNRRFPDKAVDLLEQCVAYAATQGKSDLQMGEAQTVAQRLVGMPLDPQFRLESLRTRVRERTLLLEEDLEKLVNRLSVTMVGLDLRHIRANAVVLLAEEAACASKALAETIAEACFGSADRVVTIDFSRFDKPEDLTMLIGAPPGYVGYSDSLPLHRVIQIPWCVLRFENVHSCHPQVLDVVQEALKEGHFTDARGKRIFISDTVVLLTVDMLEEGPRRLGFHSTEEASDGDVRQKASRLLGKDFVDQVDMICTFIPQTEASTQTWLEKEILPGISERFSNQGVQLSWDPSVSHWLIQHMGKGGSKRDWERLVDEKFSPKLLRSLASPGTKGAKSLLVKCKGDEIVFHPSTKGKEKDG